MDLKHLNLLSKFRRLLNRTKSRVGAQQDYEKLIYYSTDVATTQTRKLLLKSYLFRRVNARQTFTKRENIFTTL